MHSDPDLSHSHHWSADYCHIETCDAEALAKLLGTLLETFACPIVYNHLAEHVLPARLGDIFGGLAEFSSRLRRLDRLVG